MSQTRLYRFILMLLMFTCFAMQGQPYTFHSYSLSDGLPQSQVGCAYMDSRGYLWLGTEGGGICRYDGDRFEIFTTQHQLPSNFIRAILQMDDYNLWIGTSMGLAVFNGRSFYSIPGLQQAITTLSMFRDSLLLVGTTRGLYLLPAAQDSLVPFYLDSMGTVLSTCTHEGSIWIGTTTGLWRLQSDGALPSLIARFKGQGIYSICEADTHSLWLASWGSGIIRYNTQYQKIDTLYSDPLIQLTNTVQGLIDGQLWIGTQNNGLVVLDTLHHRFIHLNEKDGLPHYNIKAILPDKRSHVWITTSGGGIARCSKQNFRQYTRSEGLGNNRVYSVYVTPENKVWIASGNTGIQMLDSTGISSIRIDSLLRGIKCKTIAGEKNGRIWVGTEGGGIITIDSGIVRQFRIKDGLPDDYIQKVAVDKKGTVWVATYTGGLCSIAHDSNQVYRITNHPLPYQRLSSMTFDAQDRLWIGTNDGQLFAVENGKLIWKSTKSSGLSASAIHALAFDSFGRIWIGHENGKVYSGYPKLNAKAFDQLPLPYGLNGNNIYLILADNEGHLWFGTESGVDKMSFQTNGDIKEIVSYGRNEGFLGIETCHDAAARGPDGKLWFGTMNGLMQYSPGEEIRLHSPPVVHFENISLFYKPVLETTYAGFVSPDGGLLPGLTLEHNENHISFYFRAVDLDYPEQIVYRWKLNGIDTSWSPPSKQSSVSFASLNPGPYTLAVQAATDDGIWSTPIEASFLIRSPYWQTTSFKIISGIIFAAMLLLIFYSWSRYIKRKERAKREKLKLQNHLLQLEQKALQLQMNPHFIFNALTSIKSLVVEQHLPKAREEINAFAQLMRGILNNSRKTAITLAEEAAVLDRYLHLEQFCHQQKFDYTIILPLGVDPDEIEIPPMLIQPFVENAVVHGIAHLAHKGKIEITFQMQDDILICQVKDNGLGREKASRLREEKKPGHQPVALEVTQERLETLRGKLTYTSMKTEDVIDHDGIISGTLVTVRIPTKVNW